METYDPELRSAPKDFNELNEIAMFMGTSLNGQEAINGEKLEQALEEHGTVLVDIRSEREYRAGHIRGAISVPLELIEERAPALYGSVAGVIVYGSGDDTMEAAVAADKLKTLFFKHVSVYQDGVIGWLRKGYRLETGPAHARTAA